MKNLITIFCKNTQSYHEFECGTSLLTIYNELNIKLNFKLVAARVNHKVEDLNFMIYKPKDIEFIDMSESAGMRVYVRTLCMVLSKAITELFPEASLHIQHPISNGYYCQLSELSTPLSPDVIVSIKERVTSIIDKGLKIAKEEKQTTEVVNLFYNQDCKKEKAELFETIGNLYCTYFQMEDYIDYYNGVLLPATNYLNLFDIVPYYDGLLLCIPNRQNPNIISPAIKSPKMYGIFKEHLSWNKIIGMSNVAQFNVACKNKQSFNLIKISEALHEKKVAQIADMIALKSDTLKLVLIAGPSSSGKTTFSKRLAIQLMVNGLKPVMLSLDNYFVNREDTPLDEYGNYDFEHLHALDLPLFNTHLKQLFAGEEIEIPIFNFDTGKREPQGEKFKLHSDNVLVIEGIHGLNPELVATIPPETTFKIYVSALTTISIDNHNWIPTNDTRLLRRIVRDYKYRNYSARDTIGRWPSVRRGEEKWIYPYQENADVMFNSALIFEFAVLKSHAEPILAEVPKYCNEYSETYRLLKFLNYFAPVPESEIPPTSLLREFVGGSSFSY